MKPKDFIILSRLITTIAERRGVPPEQSYVARLLAKPVKKTAQKVAEEGAEVAIAAVSESNEALCSEMADLLFHLLILCEHKQVHFVDVLRELEQREGVSGDDKKHEKVQIPKQSKENE